MNIYAFFKLIATVPEYLKVCMPLKGSPDQIRPDVTGPAESLSE